MPNDNYYLIRKYVDVLDDFPLAIVFGKYKRKHWHETYHDMPEDVCQELAICCIESEGDKKKLNNLISRRLYYLWKWTRKIHKPADESKKNRRKKYEWRPKKSFLCDLCGADKLEYPRKSVIPGKVICGACRQRIWREDLKRNGERRRR